MQRAFARALALILAHRHCCCVRAAAALASFLGAATPCSFQLQQRTVFQLTLLQASSCTPFPSTLSPREERAHPPLLLLSSPPSFITALLVHPRRRSCVAPVLRVSFTAPEAWRPLQLNHISPSPSTSSAAAAAAAAAATAAVESSSSSTGISLFKHQTFAATVFLGLFTPSIGRSSGGLIAAAAAAAASSFGSMPHVLLQSQRRASRRHRVYFRQCTMRVRSTVLHCNVLFPRCEIVTFYSCSPRAGFEGAEMELLRNAGQVSALQQQQQRRRRRQQQQKHHEHCFYFGLRWQRHRRLVVGFA